MPSEPRLPDERDDAESESSESSGDAWRPDAALPPPECTGVMPIPFYIPIQIESHNYKYVSGALHLNIYL